MRRRQQRQDFINTAPRGARPRQQAAAGHVLQWHGDLRAARCAARVQAVGRSRNTEQRDGAGGAGGFGASRRRGGKNHPLSWQSGCRAAHRGWRGAQAQSCLLCGSSHSAVFVQPHAPSAAAAAAAAPRTAADAVNGGDDGADDAGEGGEGEGGASSPRGGVAGPGVAGPDLTSNNTTNECSAHCCGGFQKCSRWVTSLSRKCSCSSSRCGPALTRSTRVGESMTSTGEPAHEARGTGYTSALHCALLCALLCPPSPSQRHTVLHSRQCDEVEHDVTIFVLMRQAV